jgi:hypothetical protein
MAVAWTTMSALQVETSQLNASSMRQSSTLELPDDLGQSFEARQPASTASKF